MLSAESVREEAGRGQRVVRGVATVCDSFLELEGPWDSPEVTELRGGVEPEA